MMTLDELQRLFDFTENDLNANRAGQLSERQRSKMREQVRNGAVDAAATASLIPVTAVLVIAYFALVVPLANRIGAWTCLVIIVALVVIAVVASVWWKIARKVISRAMKNPGFEGWLRRRMRRSYAAPLAFIEQDIVTAHAGRLEHRSDGEHEYIFLGDEELQISVAAEPDERLWQLKPDRDYIVYMMPDMSWIVAIEPGGSE
jgi:hypothetical protein